MGLDAGSFLGTPMALIAPDIALSRCTIQRQLAQVPISAQAWRDVRLGASSRNVLAMAFLWADQNRLRRGAFLPRVFTYLLLACRWAFLRTGGVQMPECFSAFLKSYR